ncbi:MAG: hypothetical protein HUK03_08860 [Bacteroidaceae bacterium]|nr:hypothetical protein [Bacteroidaceae bacterium]
MKKYSKPMARIHQIHATNSILQESGRPFTINTDYEKYGAELNTDAGSSLSQEDFGWDDDSDWGSGWKK